MSTICGSPCYSAPEMLRGNKYKPYPIDVWGIGIILYCMICGALPFEDIKEDDLIRKVIQCDYNCPYYVNQNVRTLFKRIFCQNPNERITMEEIKLNCIYNMGKANFMKYYKIFNENGELLPQVQRFIKEKTIKYLETECSMEIDNKIIEKNTAYKIMFHTFMHKTNWNTYHIPKNIEQNVKQIEQKEQKDNNDNNIDNTKEEEQKETNKEEDILFIPPHGSLGIALSKIIEQKNEFKLNLSKDDIDAMRRLGILTHSFDTNWEPKLKGQENTYNDNIYINSNNDYDNIEEYDSNNMIDKPYNIDKEKSVKQGSYGTTAFTSQKIFNNNSNVDLNDINC
jgi:serine/threonine protein kinase